MVSKDAQHAHVARVPVTVPLMSTGCLTSLNTQGFKTVAVTYILCAAGHHECVPWASGERNACGEGSAGAVTGTT
jgi:hypothetical protein